MLSSIRVQLSKCVSLREDIVFETCSRILIVVIFVITDYAVPFKRKIQPEEVWLYQFPRSEDFINFKTLQVFIISLGVMVIWVVYKLNNNAQDTLSAILGLSLSMYLSATVTNLIKLVVGRPRPDFIERCFTKAPESLVALAAAVCDRDEETVNQGYKSFPSGHATMAMSGLSFLSLYLAHTLRLFSQPHSRYSSVKLGVTLAPTVIAILVAASRTADYHHHWQDVTVGSIIGLMFSVMCFCQGFQSILHKPVHTSVPAKDTLKFSMSPQLDNVQSF